MDGGEDGRGSGEGWGRWKNRGGGGIGRMGGAEGR